MAAAMLADDSDQHAALSARPQTVSTAPPGLAFVAPAALRQFHLDQNFTLLIGRYLPHQRRLMLTMTSKFLPYFRSGVCRIRDQCHPHDRPLLGSLTRAVRAIVKRLDSKLNREEIAQELVRQNQRSISGLRLISSVESWGKDFSCVTAQVNFHKRQRLARGSFVSLDTRTMISLMISHLAYDECSGFGLIRS